MLAMYETHGHVCGDMMDMIGEKPTGKVMKIKQGLITNMWCPKKMRNIKLWTDECILNFMTQNSKCIHLILTILNVLVALLR